MDTFLSESHWLVLKHTEHFDSLSALSAGSHLAEGYAMQSDRILQFLSTRVHFDLFPQQKWKSHTLEGSEIVRKLIGNMKS